MSVFETISNKMFRWRETFTPEDNSIIERYNDLLFNKEKYDCVCCVASDRSVYYKIRYFGVNNKPAKAKVYILRMNGRLWAIHDISSSRYDSSKCCVTIIDIRRELCMKDFSHIFSINTKLSENYIKDTAFLGSFLRNLSTNTADDKVVGDFIIYFSDYCNSAGKSGSACIMLGSDDNDVYKKLIGCSLTL